MDRSQIDNKYHFVGINGIGMSALAQILLEKQMAVTGSDLTLGALSQKLISHGAKLYEGHAKEQVPQGSTVVLSTQIRKDNPEYLAALELNCPLLHRSQLLAELMVGCESLAVTGTHGKTTTSALLAATLLHAGLDPSFAIGGTVGGRNGRRGFGRYFVLEADESDGSFLNYIPSGAIVTNIGDDHLENFQNKEALIKAFEQFMGQVRKPQLLFICADDPILAASAQKGISYGFTPGSQLLVSRYRQEGWRMHFDLHFEGTEYKEVELALIGRHNALNGASVFGLCLALGISEEKIRAAFSRFPGVGRRCEKRGEASSVLFLDDYAHHPTEITKTLFAVKEAVQERRLVALFQPHRYSRVEQLLEGFATAFEMADFVYVTDIYSAQEEPIEGIDSHLLVRKIAASSRCPCAYLPKDEMIEELKKSLMPHDVLLTLGAGDITSLHGKLIPGFELRKLKVGVLFGGRSCEHEISLRSCRSVASAARKTLYELIYFAIDKQGRWIVGEEAKEALFSKESLEFEGGMEFTDPLVLQQLGQCDVFLPILHGSFGEDGTIQGFFEMMGKPYAGPDYRSAALCMDKVLTKRIAAASGIKTPSDVHFGLLEWRREKEELIAQIHRELRFPVYVKPVHLGSSVGIACIKRAEELEAAISNALHYDTEVMVEEGKIGCRELEFAVLGNTFGFLPGAPGPGEKLAGGEFVDYEKKYGSQAVKTTLEPNLSPELLKKGIELSRRAYRAVQCSGMARVDFLLDNEGEFWLFEINTIPGLQPLSLFPKIWMREGLSFEQLIDQLIILALARSRGQLRACVA